MLKLRHLQWPFVLWMGFFVVFPLLYVLILSFASKGLYGGVEWKFSFDGYLRSLDWAYVKILLRSLRLGLMTSMLCFVLSIALAWHLATLPLHRRYLVLAWLCVPFFLNLVSRIYALRGLLGFDGGLTQILISLGVDSDWLFHLSQNQFLVLYGMVVTYLPFMLFPIFLSLESFDHAQIEAVQDLGGSSWYALRKVILPQITPAIMAGTMMVFVPATGEYVIPDLLGGAKVMLSGNLITEQFLKSRDWPFGAVLAIELMMITSLLLLVMHYLLRGRHGR